jgi:hypothetical protein
MLYLKNICFVSRHFLIQFSYGKKASHFINYFFIYKSRNLQYVTSPPLKSLIFVSKVPVVFQTYQGYIADYVTGLILTFSQIDQITSTPFLATVSRNPQI